MFTIAPASRVAHCRIGSAVPGTRLCSHRSRCLNRVRCAGARDRTAKRPSKQHIKPDHAFKLTSANAFGLAGAIWTVAFQHTLPNAVLSESGSRHCTRLLLSMVRDILRRMQDICASEWGMGCCLHRVKPRLARQSAARSSATHVTWGSLLSFRMHC